MLEHEKSFARHLKQQRNFMFIENIIESYHDNFGTNIRHIYTKVKPKCSKFQDIIHKFICSKPDSLQETLHVIGFKYGLLPPLNLRILPSKRLPKIS